MGDSVPRLPMDLRFTADQERFRAEARAWLTDRLDGRFAVVRGRGGPGDEHELFDERSRGNKSSVATAGSASVGRPSSADAARRWSSR